MIKSVATSFVCLLPLLAACPEDSSPCVRLPEDVLVEVSKDSASQNVGPCKVLPAFRIAALGCQSAVTRSADLCFTEYGLQCAGDVEITLEVKQLQDDGISGVLRKVDNIRECSLDLDILVKNVPPPTIAED